MKITAISDIHGHLPKIAPCDLLLIAGDICPNFGDRPGRKYDFTEQSHWINTKFSDWAERVPAKYIVATAGNHDWVFERIPELINPIPKTLFLIDGSTTVNGLRIHGTPWTPQFCAWAFNAPEYGEAGEQFLARRFSLIPEDTAILIAHGPPKGYGDGENIGSQALLDAIDRVKPKLCCYGHIHNSYGIYHRNESILANVSLRNDAYEIVNRPMEFEL